MDDSDTRIVDHYDELAEHWAEITQSTERTDLLWPTLDAMLGDVDGLSVLDAGCGSGVYAAKLIQQGADVIGVDASEAMIAEARELAPDAQFYHGDLAEGLDFLDDDSLDVVLCQHVFSHLPALASPIAEFARVLVDDGALVVSTHNPVHDYVVVREREYPTTGEQSHLDPEIKVSPDAPTYTETERYDVSWHNAEVANRGTYYRRPIEALFEPLLDAGFTVDDVVEPSYDGHEDAPNDSPDYPPESICLRATV